MKYVYSNWQNQSGTIPVTWNQLDYTQRTTWRKYSYQKGYTLSSAACSDIYGQNIGVMVPDTVIPVFDNVRQYFALDHLVCSLSKYTPAMILPWHSDDFPTYSKNMGISDIDQIVRIIIFLHDPAPGHQLWIEDRLCVGHAGSWFSWTGRTKHMAANIGETDRYVIQLTGVTIT